MKNLSKKWKSFLRKNAWFSIDFDFNQLNYSTHHRISSKDIAVRSRWLDFHSKIDVENLVYIEVAANSEIYVSIAPKSKRVKLCVKWTDIFWLDFYWPSHHRPAPNNISTTARKNPPTRSPTSAYRLGESWHFPRLSRVLNLNESFPFTFSSTFLPARITLPFLTSQLWPAQRSRWLNGAGDLSTLHGENLWKIHAKLHRIHHTRHNNGSARGKVGEGLWRYQTIQRYECNLCKVCSAKSLHHRAADLPYARRDESLFLLEQEQVA